MPLNQRSIYFVACMIVVLIWAGSFIFIRIGLQDFPPVTLAFYRFLIAFPFLLMLYFSSRSKKDNLLIKEKFFELSILALTGVTFFYILQFYSLKFISAGAGSTLINTTVIFMALLSALFLNEIFTKKKITGVLVAFIGASILVSNGWSIDWSSNHLLGSVLMLGAAVSWAIYSVLSKKILRDYSALALTTIVFGLGTVYSIPFVFMENPLEAAMEASQMGWISVLYLAIPSSALAYFLWSKALTRLEVSKVGATLYAIPILTIIFGYFFLGEEVTSSLITGASLVILGVYLTETA